MNFKDENNTIGTVVAELPVAGQIFNQYGIDFCCGGHRKLSLVIQEQGLDKEEIYQALEVVQKERANSYQEGYFTDLDASTLTVYIEDTHHSYLRKVLPELSDLLGTILKVHGRNHNELFEIYRLYGMLKTDLEQHLLKEETMLFPAFLEEESNSEEIYRISDEIIKEHEAAGKILTKLRIVTSDYHLPEDVCGTYAKTFDKLIELERDLHQHIHLENNILLKNYDRRSCKEV